MSKSDRVVLVALAVGVWALIAIQVTSHTPAYAASVDVMEIQRLQAYVEKVVENCRVYGATDGERVAGGIKCR